MPLQATSGAASYDAFGGGVAAVPNYIEDVFQTWLYTGNGSTQTINNGIDLAGKGGLIWTKGRSDAGNNWFVDTVRGINFGLYSNSTNAQFNDPGTFSGVSATGYSMNNSYGDLNSSGRTYASWTFREQPKFFDVVTYTGNGSATQTINHNLGSVPGCIIIKVTSQADDWYVYHRSLSQSSGVPYWLNLNTTAAETFFGGGIMLNATPTSTSFTVKGGVNGNGNTYVAYLFAHNAGGFGLTGTDNVISCGSFTTNSSGVAAVDLGWEPQWVLAKQTNGTTAWFVIDNMRGFPVKGTASRFLSPNNSTAENGTLDFSITNTGFDYDGASDAPFIYIAIRRGPMRTPTTGTSVFEPVTYTGNGATTRVVNTTITPDAGWFFHRDTANGEFWFDRLRGGGRWLQPSSAGSESSWTGAWLFDVQNAVQIRSAPADYINGSGALNGLWALKRAPGFFDEVCYTGNSTAGRTVNHNLGVPPEFIITKARNASSTNWVCYAAPLGNTQYINLNEVNGDGYYPYWNLTTPTSSVVTLGTGAFGNVNISGNNYVMYLFATCPGVSKVGSYTGNGSSQTINMGFTGGARFFLVKRTDSTGDWWVYDSARGIVSAADPALRLNSTAAEVTSADAVDTDSTGLIVNQESTCNINVSSATYIYLGIS